MFNFDVERFLSIEEGAVSLKDSINNSIDEVFDGGIESIFFIGSGGAGILMEPAVSMIRKHSKFPAFVVNPSELTLTGHSYFNKKSLAILPSLSGTTKETIEVAKFCKEKGVTTISLVGHANTPLANNTDYTFVNYAQDDTSCESFFIQSYLIASRIMYKNGDFPAYAEFLKEIEKLPKQLLYVKEKIEPRAEQFADEYKDEKYHILTSSGSSWPETYYYGMCILEEMQWIRTRPVHASDFFHGTLELVEKDVSIILLKGEDETRPLVDRVENFAKEYTEKLTIFDTKDFDLDLSDKFRGLFSPIILATLLERVSCYLENRRNHPLTTRRYYRKVAY